MSTLPVEQYLGSSIRVTTTFNEEIEGELFCFDSQSNSVVICQKLDNGNVNYKWTKANIIREVIATGGPSGQDEELPNVDLRYVEARAKKLEEQAAREAKRYGVGVTEHAQEVFDALNKTMEASWDGEDIKVLGVKITKPYDPIKNISGGDTAAQERIRKVLQAELQKREGKKKATTPGSGK
mmetsp:Transcript_24446/g.44862  ORF Transcript_24446/g.44862 Transcript_24446/m.44862 type:complete len:182 (-) Transcript_24446:63-608(-)